MDVLAANLGEIAKWLVIAGIAFILIGSLMQPSLRVKDNADGTTETFWQLMGRILKEQFALIFAKDTPSHMRLTAIGFALVELGIIALVAGLAAGAAAAAGGGGGTPTPTPTPTAT